MFNIFPKGFNKGPYTLICFQRILGANPVSKRVSATLCYCRQSLHELLGGI